MVNKLKTRIYKTFNKRMNAIAQTTFNNKKEKRLEATVKARETRKRRLKK